MKEREVLIYTLNGVLIRTLNVGERKLDSDAEERLIQNTKWQGLISTLNDVRIRTDGEPNGGDRERGIYLTKTRRHV